jgi:mannose-6-phosphate isomerase
MPLYPLKFKPRYLEKMWGGRKIETILGKALPPGLLVGESWEIYDFPPGVVDSSKDWISSEVADGPLAGETLHDLVQLFPGELLGSAKTAGRDGQFPLLIKFLDAKDDLSLQVHPDEAYARANPQSHLKNEAWYILQADANSRLLMGMKSGVDRQAFVNGIAEGSVESLINAVAPKAGDCFYLASGTVHALGAGILAAEVQTPSDTTFRVFDFNRIDPSTGKLRTLHVDQAMQCIDFSAGPQQVSSQTWPVGCAYFSIEPKELKSGEKRSLPTGELAIWMMIEGAARLSVESPPESVDIRRGETVLFPAILNNPHVEALEDCRYLSITIPRRA